MHRIEPADGAVNLSFEVENMKYEWSRRGDDWILNGGSEVLCVRGSGDCQDRFTLLEEGVWLWERHMSQPVEHMRMELDTAAKAEFTMIPGVSYNGNGWGDSEEYVGDRDGDTPWTFAWHRCTIPACTFSQWDGWAVALMAETADKASCSLYAHQERTRHCLLWPEQEGPRVLMRHYWDGPFMGSMEPRQDFRGIIHVAHGVQPHKGYRELLDFAWRHYGHKLKPSMKAEDLYRYGVAYFKSLWTREKSGFCAFNRGLQWYEDTCYYAKRNEIMYEIGWVGQSASISCALLWEYLRSGDTDARDKAIDTLDSWVRQTRLPNGLIRVKFDREPGEGREFPNDACNLSDAARGFFNAYDLAQKAGIHRPEYVQTALGICDFVRGVQHDSGEYAKSWDCQGNVIAQSGTIGCFMIRPMLMAYQRTGDEGYLASARRAFDFYYRGLEDNGFTTAGALDTYCIDKESSSPLLASALALYRQTGEQAYLDKAENIAWYLSTWMMFYTVQYPADTVCGQIGFDTLGMTVVSTAHNAIDQYAVHDILSFMDLAKLTGHKRWQEWAMAFWCSTTQLVSDGTLCIAGRIRPAGSQDEAVYHTRWARPTLGPYQPTQWLVAWPCAFRMEILRTVEDWSILDAGMEEQQ